MDPSDFLRNPSDSDSGHNGDLGNGSNSIDNDLESPTLDTVSGFSSCSSPIPAEPFQPRFSIWFTDDVYKDGDIVNYTIKTIPTDKQPHTEYFVQRQYEDFEWLEHCLLTSNPVLGIIVPPLPPKPAITSEMAEAKSKKQLGSNTRTLMGDDFFKDCRVLEEYLRLLLAHPLFGNDLFLEKFLTAKEAPVRAKVKKGLLSRISDSLDSRKGSHKDCEDFFQKERDWTNNYGHAIKETSQSFNAMIYSQQRLCGVIGHLATTFTLCVGVNGNDDTGLRDCVLLSDALENYKHGFEVESFNRDRTLGSFLELYTKYIEAEKEMLARRTGLLVDYENANKSLDKAKPNKRDSAEESKLAAEKAFEECSDVARQEIKRFHRQRVQTFGGALEKFAEFQVKNARDVCALLAKSLNQIVQQQAKDEPLPLSKG